MPGDKAPILPNDPDMERAVLGAMLTSRDDALAAVERLAAEDFYNGRHRLIFGAGTAVFEHTQAVDIPLLAAELKSRGHLHDAGGKGYLAEIVEATPTNAPIEPYIEAVREHSLKRQLWEMAVKCQRTSMNGRPAAEVASEFATLFAAVEESIAGRQNRTGLGDILADVFARLGDERPEVWPTGIRVFDDFFGGVLPGEFIVIAAKRKGGKSTLALQWARNWGKAGRRVLVCSYEMSADLISQVFTASEAGVALRKDWSVKNRSYDEDWPRVEAAREALSGLPIFVECCAGKRLAQLEAMCRLYQRKHKIEAVIVDYVQQIEPDQAAERRDLDIAASSRRLKALAQSMRVPVIGLSQLNDAGQTRESRTLEHDCDMLVHIEAPENAGAECQAQLIVKANRSGPTGVVEVKWQRGWRRFDEAGAPGEKSVDDFFVDDDKESRK